MGFLFSLSDTYICMVYFSAHTIWLNINVSVPTLFIINICVDVRISNKDMEGSSNIFLERRGIMYPISRTPMDISCFLMSSFVVEPLAFLMYTS